MQELKLLLEEISRTGKMADLKVSAKNSGTVQNLLGRKRSAQLRLPELKRKYRNELRGRILPVIVAGSGASEFLSLASEKVGAITVDGEALYKELLKRMPSQASSGKMTTKVIVDILSSHFMDIANESEVISYPSITHNNRQSFAVKNKNDLEKLIKQVVNSKVGSEFTMVYNLVGISERAIEMEFSSKTLPVLVGVEDESLVDEIVKSYQNFLGAAFLLTAGELKSNMSEKALASVDSVTEESVSSALKKVKTALKKKKGE